MKQEQFGKPIIAVVNSFTQFVPGHTHLHEIGQIVREEIEKMGCYAAEFNTIAIDDGIAMGHDGMLYSLPSRDIIADSVEYMVNAHKADAMICISNCDKITPGMLMAAMRLNIPAVFVSGGPMEAGRWRGENADLITAMVKGADPSISDEELAEIASRYDSVAEFIKKDKNAYLTISKRGLLDKLCANMKREKSNYADEELAVVARDYEDLTKFKTEQPNVYAAIQRRGMIGKL